MLVIYDDFTRTIHSRHRSLEAAANALKRHQRQFYRNNSANSYLPWELMHWDKATGELSRPDSLTVDAFERLLLG